MALRTVKLHGRGKHYLFLRQNRIEHTQSEGSARLSGRYKNIHTYDSSSLAENTET